MGEDGNTIPSSKILFWFEEKGGNAIRNLLSANTCQVVNFSDADQGLTLMDDTIDLLLIQDIHAAGQGKTLIRKIKQNEKWSMIPIVALSKKAISEPEIGLLFSMGVNDCLSIPCKGLIPRIQAHIQNKKQLEGLRKLNFQLESELEYYKKQNSIILEFSKTIENDLLDKIDRLNSGENPENLKKEIMIYQAQLAELSEERERLRHDNEVFREELNKFQKINSVVIMHSQALDEDMYQKINHISHKANTDHLTGIFNRLKFHENLYQEITGVKNRKRNLSIIMFDIDHFKAINDLYGHDVGDEVLLDLTAFVSSKISETDTFARWGGEEFMLLMPGKSSGQASEAAENLRNEIERQTFAQVERLTCSFGVTQYLGEDTALFLKRVDCAMYLAKKKGRNRVEVS
jgi:diguanylate cyclase (GGDEF)-like protein